MNMLDAIILTEKEMDIILALREGDCTAILYGKVTLNFANGLLQNCIKEEMVYKRLAPSQK